MNPYRGEDLTFLLSLAKGSIDFLESEGGIIALMKAMEYGREMGSKIECPSCPIEARALHAIVKNYLGALGRDDHYTRLQRKLTELREESDRFQKVVDHHFAHHPSPETSKKTFPGIRAETAYLEAGIEELLAQPRAERDSDKTDLYLEQVLDLLRGLRLITNKKEQEQ